MGQYYYLDGQTPLGPFSLRDVYTLLDREVINPTTLMCREGGAEWLELITLHELTGKIRARSVVRNSVGEGLSTSSSGGAEEGSTRRRRRGSSSSSTAPVEPPPPNRLVNLTAIIIAVLFSVVAVYVTYTIGHANQEVSIDQIDQAPAMPPVK